MAAELAPLCSRVDFQGRCLQENEGFGKPYYWVTQKRLFWLCFKFPREISTQGHETKSQAQKGRRDTVLRFRLPADCFPSHWITLVWTCGSEKDQTLWNSHRRLPSQPPITTLCHPNSAHSFVGSYQEATMKERNPVWRRLQGKDMGVDRIQWLPLGTSSLEGNWLVCWAKWGEALK